MESFRDQAGGIPYGPQASISDTSFAVPLPTLESGCLRPCGEGLRLQGWSDMPAGQYVTDLRKKRGETPGYQGDQDDAFLRRAPMATPQGDQAIDPETFIAAQMAGIDPMTGEPLGGPSSFGEPDGYASHGRPSRARRSCSKLPPLPHVRSATRAPVTFGDRG